MTNLNYEVLHKNVYYFPKVIKGIEDIMGTLEKVNSLSVTPWEIWYANNDAKENPYGDLKVLTWRELENEPPETKAQAEYILNSIVSALEQCGKIFMEAHGATTEDIEGLHNDLYVKGQVFGIRRYNEGLDMGPHSDRVLEDRDTYTIAAYLDDDYDGGELVVHTPDSKIEITLYAGSIVVFPSAYLHESKKLLRGRKTMLTHVHDAQRKILEL